MIRARIVLDGRLLYTPVMKTASLAALFAAALLGQTGGIQGVVLDESGAVIPGAKIVITNLDTGLRREIDTNDTGFYAAPLLPVGRYRMEAGKAGFGTSERPEVKLDVQQTARLDFQLKTGRVIERVEVSATAALLDSETSTVGQVIDNKRIVELPLNGRNYLNLAALTAGTAPSVGGRTSDEGGFVAAGQHGYQVNITVDGLDNNSRSSGGPLGFEAQAVKPSIDAVGEFRVVTNNLSAEYGYRMGGAIFVNIKSGTNQLHGSALEFLRNSSLDGTNFFANRSGARKPPYRQNQFGATLGGPIRKDKTFLFGSFEGTRIRLGRSFVTTVPTLEGRGGDFRRTRPVFDPATTTGSGGTLARQAFGGGVVPRSRWDPLFPALLALYPLPTDSARITNNYFSSPTESNDSNTYDFKGDHNLSDRSRLSIRYSRRDKDRFEPGPLPLPADGGLGTTTSILAHSVVASHTQTFGASFNNEVRFGFSRLVTRFDIPGDKALFDQFGIKGIPSTNLSTSNNHGLTRFTPQGYVELGSRSFWPNFNNLDLFQFSDVAFKSLGKHSIKLGGDWKRENVFRNAARFGRGQFAFNREFTANPQNRAATGDGLAEFMLGLASGGTVGNENGENLNARTLALFVQDDWKVSPRLTLNLGLRYDIFFLPTFPGREVTNFLLDYANTGASARLKQVRPSSGGDCLCQQDYNNFGPRVGAAYRLDNRTVLRTGVGVIFAQADSLSTQSSRARQNAPDFIEFTFETLDRINPRLVLKDGFPRVQLPATVVPGPASVSVTSQESHYPAQYSQQWFVDVQRELPFDILATAAYAANGTRQLIANVNYNLPVGPSSAPIASRRVWPFYTAVNRQQSLGNLSYQALTLKAEKRFSRGLQFLSAFTWAHTIDNVTEDLNQSGAQGAVNPWDLRKERANSVADIRRYFVFSGTYELPIRAPVHALKPVLEGWQVGGILSLRAGLPFTVTTSGGITNAGGADRPNRLRSGALSGSERSIDRWFDLSAFQVQPQYTFGNSGRNILFGPGLRNLDFTLAKSFSLREGMRLQFRFESFNLSNTPVFGLPAAAVNAPGAGAINSAGEPRRIQFGLKLLM